MQDLKQEVIRGLRGRSRGELERMGAQLKGVSFSFLYQLALGVYESEPTYRRLMAVKRHLDSNPPEDSPDPKDLARAGKGAGDSQSSGKASKATS